MAGPIHPKLLPITTTFSDEGRTFVGGRDVCEIAEEFGTPLFLYDEHHLRQRCRDALWAFGSGVAYGSKAFLCLAMAKLVDEEGLHIDVASAGEAYTALRAGVPATRLVMHGNNKSTAELTYALERGIGRIVVDSVDELERLARLGGFGHPKPKVLLRVTPGVKAHTHEFMATGHEDQKFGLSIEGGAATDAVLRCRGEGSGVELVGIHCHIGSQIFDAESYAKTIAIVAPFFIPLGLPELVVGGGLGAPYVEEEVNAVPTYAEWAAAINRAVKEAGISGVVRLGVEPGRSIAANAAMTVYRVGTIKTLPEIRTYVSIDGGMSDNPRPALYGSGYEAFLPRNGTAERSRPARIVGKHCETGDVLINEAWVPDDIRVGDLLATPATGAYGYTMANNYNKLPRPAVVFVHDSTARVVVRRETYDDLLRLDSL